MVHVIRDPQTRREVLYIDEPAPPNYLGTTGLVFSILGLVTCGALSPIGLLLSVIGLTGKRRGGAIAGVLLALLGLAIPGAFIFSAVKEERDRHREQVVQTARSVLESARVKIDELRAEEKALPDGVAGNKFLLEEGFRDPWNVELRYELHDDQKSYSLRSAGPDSRFDTRDDVAISIGADALHEPIGGKDVAAAEATEDARKDDPRQRRHRDRDRDRNRDAEEDDEPRYEPLDLDLDLEYTDR